MTEIKKKTVNSEIKSKEKIVDINHHLKKNALHLKDSVNKDKEESQNTYAINRVSDSGKKASSNIKDQSIRIAKKQRAKEKAKKDIKKQSVVSSKGLTELNKKRTVQNNLKTKSSSDSLSIKNKNVSLKKAHGSQHSYQQRIRRFIKFKSHNRFKNAGQPANGSRTFLQTFKGSFAFVRKAVLSVSNLVGAGISLILLVIIILFIGIFGIFSDDSSVSSDQQPLSNEVLAYTDTIEKYAKQYEMEDYIPIIQAVMMQESGGKGTDPMQSSECPYNTKYSNKPNAIQDADYSIDVGIHYLSDCFSKAKVQNVFDNEHIFLALQGYNYGNGYIDWAVKNFGGYSKANAKVFSDQKKAELQTDVYGDPDYVEHVMRYVSLGFGNYREQPNFNNTDAWGNNNPYSQAKLYGQCTWFAWGRFYEIYGYSPGFIGNGNECVDQLLEAHPDKFERSDEPATGAVFSCVGRNHVGIVIGWDGTNITIQEGNLDGKTNTFEDAKKDWHTATYTFEQFKSKCKGVVFAVSKK